MNNFIYVKERKMENISDIENFNIQPIIIEFLNNTLTIHDSKIYKLKKYYYDWASNFLKLDSVQDLKIGSNKNKNLLFFNSVKESDKHLILKLDDNTHFIYIKDFNKEITSSTKKKYSIKSNLIDKNLKSYYCFNRCSIL